MSFVFHVYTVPYISENISRYRTELDNYMVHWKGIFIMDERKFYHLTGCQTPCSRWEYSSTQIFNKEQQPPKGSDPIMNLYVFYANNNYEIKEQYYTYDWNSLISDLGGYLGLLLGASVLTFYDAVSSLHDVWSHFFIKK